MSDSNEDEFLDLEIEDEEEDAPIVKEEDEKEDEKEKEEDEKKENEPSGLMAKLARHKILLIFVALIVLISGVVAGLYFTGMLTAKKSYEISMALPGETVFQVVPKITVDLKPSPKHARPFIRLIVQVQLQGKPAKVAFIERETRILDAIQSHLRTLTVGELQDQSGTELLRTDLTSIINNIIRPERAITVYYKEIMIR